MLFILKCTMWTSYVVFKATGQWLLSDHDEGQFQYSYANVMDWRGRTGVCVYDFFYGSLSLWHWTTVVTSISLLPSYSIHLYRYADNNNDWCNWIFRQWNWYMYEYIWARIWYHYLLNPYSLVIKMPPKMIPSTILHENHSFPLASDLSPR